MRIVIVHYHFFPGGVTSAVRSSLLAMKSAGRAENIEFVLLCGHERGIGELTELLRCTTLNIKGFVHPELFYRQEIWPSREAFEDEAIRISELLLGYGKKETIFWVHNPTIGKNPALTRALIIAAQKAEKESLPYCFLYHIHDFPECGRPNNLKYLLNCYPGGGLKILYPESLNTFFICINSSDRGLLIQSGVPESKVFFLPNAISVNYEAASVTSTVHVDSALEKYAEKHGYVFKKGSPWWLMPIRLIRRKNALEAFFLEVLDEGMQILITLDANSQPEYPYANAVKDVIRREKASGMVGFGAELVGKAFSFDELILASRAIVTTSLMEGFGFAFLEGPIHGKPVIGRNLPHVTKDFGQLGLPLDDLYDSFYVPVAENSRRQLKEKFQIFALQYFKLAGVRPLAVDRYLSKIDEIYENEAVDFGFLDLETQLDLFCRLKDPGFRNSIRVINKRKLKYPEIPSQFVRSVDRAFGYQKHAKILDNIFNTIQNPDLQFKIPSDLSQKLREAFFAPERNKPLFW